MNLRINRQVRAPRVRLIDKDGRQVGVVSSREALTMAEEVNLDLVEIAPNAEPPVCKIIDYGKYRYDQTKREKENKKAQHQIKVKEVKVKPNIDEHDFQTKLKKAREFLVKGNKVKITCTFRGRQNAYPEQGQKVVERLCEETKDIAMREAPLKKMGRNMTTVLAPLAAGKGTSKKKDVNHA